MAALPHVKVAEEDWEGVGTGDAEWDNRKSDNTSWEAGWCRLGVRKWREICAVGSMDEHTVKKLLAAAIRAFLPAAPIQSPPSRDVTPLLHPTLITARN